MKKLTTDQFIDKFYKRYTNGLDLDLSKFEYVTARTESITICNKHNIIIQNTANNLLQGIKKCKQCKSEAISISRAYTIDDFINRSKKTHGDRYDYSEAIWVDSRHNVKIICSKHGPFMQNPQSHWTGFGCPSCGYSALRKTNSEFITEASEVHNNKYYYDKVDYVNNYTPVTITCKEHGDFSMAPKAHILYQRGCPVCYPGNRSWPEIAWLNELGIPNECRQKYIVLDGKRIIVDAKVGNVIYEFWGDFWHGNPSKFKPDDKNTKCNKTFKELYTATMNKRNNILNAGYILIEMWESDFNKLNKGKNA